MKVLEIELNDLTIPTTTAQQRGSFYVEKLKRISHYKKKPLKQAEKLYWDKLYPLKPSEPFKGGIMVNIEFYFAYNTSCKKSNVDKMEIVPKITRPDLDNMSKVICDTMTKLGYWEDDSRIYELRLRKFFAPKEKISIRIQGK